ncbi:MAG: hypothetical protein ACFNX6_13010, partial [Lautropia mirabilis]
NQSIQQEENKENNQPTQSIIKTVKQATDNYLKDVNYSNNNLFATGVNENTLKMSTIDSGYNFTHLNKKDLISKFKSNCQITGQPWINADAHNCFSGIYFGKLEISEKNGKTINTNLLCYTSMTPNGIVRHGYENNIYPEEKFSHGIGAYLFKTNPTNDTHLIYDSSTLQMGAQWPGFRMAFSWDTINGEISLKHARSDITQGGGKRCRIW